MDSKFLSYKKISIDELPHLFGIMKNSQYMRYSVDLNTYEKCLRYVRNFSSQWDTLGYGCWSITEKSTGSIIGWGGIVIDEDDPKWGPELVYYIAPEKSGCGYASELAEFSMNYAATVIGLNKVVAFAHPENIASNRILVKVGFKPVRYLKAMNRNYFEFSLDT
ncbi:GNAT family N-acetyltransferase [Celerinatantimonas yamalensis]|uniref:GNAT family N-acetyltransferase n=1 Tax=Celerinatantimonas yamalensis TaxID=559956 RepID=A0ABW9GBH8_9GAMM